MYTISKTFSFCYGHRLLNDECRCRHLHGHTAKTTLVLGTEELDERGMVFHFDRLKSKMGNWIAENLDHTLLLSREDPLRKALDNAGERYLIFPGNPTAENIAKMVFDNAEKFDLPVIKVEIWESETSSACYEK